MHGGCNLCSHQSTSQQKHWESQLFGKVTFPYLLTDMGHRAFLSFNIVISKTVTVCLHTLAYFSPVPLQQYGRIGRTGRGSHSLLCMSMLPFFVIMPVTTDRDREPKRAFCHPVKGQRVSEHTLLTFLSHITDRKKTEFRQRWSCQKQAESVWSRSAVGGDLCSFMHTGQISFPVFFYMWCRVRQSPRIIILHVFSFVWLKCLCQNV